MKAHQKVDYWGIDLGGTKVEGAVCHFGDSLREVARLRIPTEQENGYEHVLGRVSKVIELLQEQTGLRPKCIGLGHPGSLNTKTGLLRNSNTLCLNGRSLLDDLKSLLGLPIVCANDANCFALAEASYGAGQNQHSVFGVILGTGVGGGLVVDGCILNGKQGIAGEWGHNVLEPAGEPCYCGKQGCVETVLSGPALEAWYQRQTGSTCSLEELNQGKWNSTGARETLRRLQEKLAEALSVVINIFDPDCIVLGGGLSNISEVYEVLPGLLKQHIFVDEPEVHIVKNSLGDSAGVIGAALLTLNNGAA